MKTITVDIDSTGKVKIDAIGFTGNACEKATAALQSALGTVKSVQRKPGYSVQTKHNQQQKAGQ